MSGNTTSWLRSGRNKPARTEVCLPSDESENPRDEENVPSTSEEVYINQLRKHVFGYAAMNRVNYTYSKNLESESLKTQRQRRTSMIARELANLPESLPISRSASIFVRADEDNNSVIKALVIGPEGTPYANGCFEFDVLLPADYPSSPPSVTFVTTGGGTMRFNPNLYASGKVCLSLLGTWSGPAWVPGKSDLWQVLVSIQSLIMVADPFFNEPGFESAIGTVPGNKSTRAYNAAIQQGTLLLGILGPLSNPGPLFRDVIKTHFKLKRAQVSQQCDDWEQFMRDTNPNNATMHSASSTQMNPTVDATAQAVVRVKSALEQNAAEGGGNEGVVVVSNNQEDSGQR